MAMVTARVAAVVVLGGASLLAVLHFMPTTPEPVAQVSLTQQGGIVHEAPAVSVTEAARPDARHVAANRPDLRATFATMQRNGDLFALYRELSTRRTSADLGVARRILAECLQVSSSSNVYRRVADSSMTRIGNGPELNEKQKAATREMVSRCAGFDGWQPGAFRSESSVLALKEAEASDDDAATLNTLEHHDAPSDAMLRRTLAAGNPYAIATLEGILPARWLSASGGSPSPQDEGAASIAFRQMICAIGSDCSADSLLALTGCVFNAADCGKTQEEQLAAHLDADEATKAGDYRVRMTTAVRDRDFAAFGL